jgi:hypothetical protein
METRGGLYFPIKLKCTDPDALLKSGELSSALGRALGRSFARVRASLLPDRAYGEGVNVNRARFEGSVPLDPDQQKALLAIIDAAIESALSSADIPLAPRSSGHTADMEVSESETFNPGQYDPLAPRSSGHAADMEVSESETFNPGQYDPFTASYLLPSYDTGKKAVPVPVRRKDNPFAKIQKLYDPAMAALQALWVEGAEPAKLNALRKYVLEGLFLLINLVKDEGFAVDLILRIWQGEADPEKLPEADKQRLKFNLDDFLKDGKPNAESIANSEKYLRHWLFMAPLIRARLSELDKQAKLLSGPDPIAIRTAILDVGSYYIEAIRLSDEEGAERIAFLDTYYADRSRIAKYAIVRWAMDMYTDAIQPNLPPRVAWHDLWLMDQVSQIVYQHVNALEGALFTESGSHTYGDLPKSQDEVAREPERREISDLVKQIFRLQVEVAITFLLQEVDRIMSAAEKLPQSDEWWDELLENKNELIEEWKRPDHDAFMNGIQARADRLNEIHKEVYKAVRNLDTRRKLGEILPFMLIAGVASAGIGAWVLEVTAGNVLVAMFAEGAALTIFNGALMPAAQRPKGVVGWTLQFGENVFLVGMGKLIGVMLAPELTEALPSARRVVLSVAGTFTANTALQTAVQALDAWAKRLGGESSFTELLSMNTVMNLGGMMLGSSVGPNEGSSVTPAQFAGMSRPEQIQVLKNAWAITDDVAQRWLTLHDDLGSFDRNAERIAKAAQARKLSEREFENWRKEALENAKKLNDNLDLVEKVGGAKSRQDFAVMLDRMVQAVKDLKYSELVKPLPELTEGLSPVGDGHSYTFDPFSFSRSRMKALRDFYCTNHPDAKIEELQGGGLEVRAKDGTILFQALPYWRGAKVPRSLDSLATGSAPKDPVIPLDATAQGPKAMEGLKRVRAQGAAPELEARLAQAAQAEPTAVLKLLQILGRGDATKHGEVWTGMSNYLKNGSVRTLARVLGLSGDTDGRSAFSVLRQIARWQPNEIAGLDTIYQIRPTTTVNEINVFLGDLGPDAVREILNYITTIAPKSDPPGLRSVIGRLFTPFRPPARWNPKQVAISSQQAGAIGVLYAAVQLSQRYPGMHIFFESPDATPHGGIRIEDIALFDPTTGKRVRGFEVKEVTSAFLGDRAPGELAKDIALDYAAREWARASGRASAPFDNFRWLIRRYDIEAEATKRLIDEGFPQPSAEQIDQKMRAMVRENLKAAFDNPEVRDALPKPVQAEYRKSFDDALSFVEFF